MMLWERGQTDQGGIVGNGIYSGAQRMLELHDEGMSLSDMAVIYRSHYHCMELQMELTRRGIPHEVRSGMRLFEEERRLFYVAVTRSKDHLYLAYPTVYHSREGEVILKASRFIKEISEHRYEKWLVEGDDDLPTVDISASAPTPVNREKFFWEK